MFSKKKITFYTVENFKFHPQPTPAYKSFPNWYKDSFKTKSKCPFKNLFDSQIELDRSISGCPGITDYLKTGYIIPAWTDFIFRNIDNKLVINWGSNANISYGSVEQDQFIGIEDNKKPLYGAFHKINTPWIIKTSPGVSCMILHPEWYRNDSWKSSSGILHTDKIPLNLNWFFEWKKELSENCFNEKVQVIRHGTPLMLIVPFKRTTFESDIKYVNYETFKCLEDQNKEFISNKIYTESLYSKFRKSIQNLFY